MAEAIALADADVDFNDFDNDGNGWVDNVAVMYAGNGPDNGGYDGADPDVNSLWPHASSLGAAVAVDGINAQTYYIAAELLNSTPRLRTIGVYAHEFGHKLGLPDLYDTDDEPDDSAGIGHWCLMASGSWCSNNPGSENGESPSHMSAWCKSFMGWMTPTDLTGIQRGPIDAPGRNQRLRGSARQQSRRARRLARQRRVLPDREPSADDVRHRAGRVRHPGLAHRRIPRPQPQPRPHRRVRTAWWISRRPTGWMNSTATTAATRAIPTPVPRTTPCGTTLRSPLATL